VAAESASTATESAAATTTSATTSATMATAAVPREGGGWKRRHAERNRCRQCKLAQHDTSS
jgi:hypothetical protein